MKRCILALLALSLFLAFPAGAQNKGGTTLDTTVATIELIRKAPITLKQLKVDTGRMETMLGKKMTLDERKDYLDLMINDLLFLQFCEREKLSVTDAEINQTIQQMKTQVMSSLATNPQGVDQATMTNWASSGTISDDAFFNILGKLGVQTADLKLYVKKRLLLKKFVAGKQSDIAKIEKPSFDEVNAYYIKNADSLVRPDAVKLAILFVDTRNRDDAGKRKAKETAEGLYAKVKGDSAKFNEAVLRSLDSKAGYAGTAEYYYAKSPEFQKLFGEKFYNAAFALKQGEMSSLLEGPNGFHIIRAAEVFPSKKLELSDPINLGEKTTVFEYIQQNLYNANVDKALQDILNSLVKDLRAKAKITVKADLLNW
jgi:parvulin-like peptidyl-prolyl isomerase